jgi:hypothetical protein
MPPVSLIQDLKSFRTLHGFPEKFKLEVRSYGMHSTLGSHAIGLYDAFYNADTYAFIHVMKSACNEFKHLCEFVAVNFGYQGNSCFPVMKKTRGE